MTNCPACGSRLAEWRSKLICEMCCIVVESCCDGGDIRHQCQVMSQVEAYRPGRRDEITFPEFRKMTQEQKDLEARRFLAGSEFYAVNLDDAEPDAEFLDELTQEAQDWGVYD